MATTKKQLGDWGEQQVASTCSCPKCKLDNTIRLLPTNFRCADLICDFCGYLAQVKTSRVKDIEKIPSKIPGAAWAPQKDRMDAGIYFPLFLVLTTADLAAYSIYFLPADLQPPGMFIPRQPLGSSAKRAGWQGYQIDCESVKSRFVKLA